VNSLHLSHFEILDTIGTRAMGPAFRSIWVAENRPSQNGLMAPDHAVYEVAR
jgi:hypothetical protein